MDLYEHMGKDLFRAHGIATPRGLIAETPEAAAAATVELGGSAVVKIQVQVGGRGKGGGVALCRSPERGDRGRPADARLRFQGPARSRACSSRSSCRSPASSTRRCCSTAPSASTSGC